MIDNRSTTLLAWFINSTPELRVKFRTWFYNTDLDEDDYDVVLYSWATGWDDAQRDAFDVINDVESTAISDEVKEACHEIFNRMKRHIDDNVSLEGGEALKSPKKLERAPRPRKRATRPRPKRQKRKEEDDAPAAEEVNE